MKTKFQPDNSEQPKSQKYIGVALFIKLVNNLIRSYLKKSFLKSKPKPCVLKTFRMGFNPSINLDKGLTLADSLHDQEVITKLTPPSTKKSP